MTKSVPVLLSDGRIAFPAYQEMGQNFPVMLVLDENGRVVDRRRMGDGGEVGYQPSIVVTGPTTAVALIRPLRSNPLKKILVSRTNDGGKTWSVATPTNLPNPGGALSAIRYDSTRMLLAFNDDPDSEHDISLAISDLAGTTWRNLGALVRVNKSDNDLVMYPYLIESQPGQFDVIYSRAVKSINHIRVSSTWVQNQLQTIAAQN
jgi:predicted neuraminidase